MAMTMTKTTTAMQSPMIMMSVSLLLEVLVAEKNKKRPNQLNFEDFVIKILFLPRFHVLS